MYMVLMFSLFLIFLVIFLMLLNFILMKKSFLDREKISPFECGFDPITESRFPFSINFFLVGLIFLIFDIEIILLMPMIYSMKFMSLEWIFSVYFIIMLLLIGIYMEWSESSIMWMK